MAFWLITALTLLAPVLPGCSAPAPTAPGAALHLALPLPKPLARVVHRLVATLEGPGMEPVVFELDHSPLGPATGILGALPPGEDRTLSIEGFDLVGALIFVGAANKIAIVPGDTARVELELSLASAPLPIIATAPHSPNTYQH